VLVVLRVRIALNRDSNPLLSLAWGECQGPGRTLVVAVVLGSAVGGGVVDRHGPGGRLRQANDECGVRRPAVALHDPGVRDREGCGHEVAALQRFDSEWAQRARPANRLWDGGGAERSQPGMNRHDRLSLLTWSAVQWEEDLSARRPCAGAVPGRWGLAWR